MSNKDLHWLAGLLEGEGCFLIIKNSHTIAISLEMCDEDVVARAANLLNSNYFSLHPRNPKHKMSYKLSKRASGAYEMMRLLKPLMGQRRSDRIAQCLDWYEQKAAQRQEVLRERMQMYEDIRTLFQSGHSAKWLANKYSVTNYRIYQIIRGES